MFNSILEKLTTWFSKYFVISTFLPVSVFAFLHAWLLGRVSSTVRVAFRTLVQHPDVFTKTFAWSAIMVGLVIVAYVLSSVNGTLREILEGRHLGGPLTRALTRQQHQRRDSIRQRLDYIRDQRGEIEFSHANWKNLLVTASQFVPAGSPKRASSLWSGNCERWMKVLRRRWSSGSPIDANDIRRAVTLLVLELTVNPCEEWTSEYEDLFRIIDYAITKQKQEHARYSTRLEFHYPAGPLEPTKMGNIAATMRSYADTRYEIDLDTFWSRMQKTLQDQKDFYAALQDSKAQLDFLILMTWLTASFTAVWIGILALYTQAIFLLPAIGILGAVVTSIWYRLGCVSYQAFAAQVRSAIDLYRLDFINSLHLPIPADLVEETQLWVRLGKWAKFGEKTNISYTMKK